MKLDNTKKIAVLDLTHGGKVIAKKIKGIVTAIDVYNTLSKKDLDELEKSGIKTSQKALCACDFDVIVSPVHLDSNYPMLLEAKYKKIPIISHHTAVGLILKEHNLKGKILIEITGTKAKTSTALLLADILSKKKKVISHTSHGLENKTNGKIIKKGLSITPASLLIALDEVTDEFDIFISEISIGGTGYADIGVITTIANDYKIANNTKLASEAKHQMIMNAKPDSKLVINNDVLKSFGSCRKDITIISFSDKIDASCNVYYEEIGNEGATISYNYNNSHGKIKISKNPNYDLTSYKTAFVCASAVSLLIGIDSNSIENSIKNFNGVEGRMQKRLFFGRKLIDNSNSGMDIKTVENAFDFSKLNSSNEKLVIILGEEAKEVCEGLEPYGVKSFIDKHINDIDVFILVGERMKPFVDENKNIYYASDLKTGLELAKEKTKEKDIILSCVKCFR